MFVIFEIFVLCVRYLNFDIVVYYLYIYVRLYFFIFGVFNVCSDWLKKGYS